MKKLEKLKLNEVSNMEMSSLNGGGWLVEWTETCSSATSGSKQSYEFNTAQEAQDFMLSHGSMSCVTSMVCQGYVAPPIIVNP